MNTEKAIVVGAGILGLATARALAIKGYNVTVIERSERAVGASIRNFGMIWPVGQEDGKYYNRAMQSRKIWKEIADEANIWYQQTGSLHTAYYADEWQVLQELEQCFSSAGRSVQLLDKNAVTKIYPSVNPDKLFGGLYSGTEIIIDPGEAIAKLPLYLHEKYGVKFIWGKAVTSVAEGILWMGEEMMHATIICVCSGSDFETLFPEQFAALPITKCKLQMMRFKEKSNSRIGTALCGGLSLIHYKSFRAAPSLQTLKERYQNEMKPYLDHGIHVMVSQNKQGEITVGDSHEYGNTFNPFDKAYINEMIVDYLKQFALIGHWQLIETWHGIYPKMTNGKTDIFIKPLPGVFIINGLDGLGMTMSFGFAEEVISML